MNKQEFLAFLTRLKSEAKNLVPLFRYLVLRTETHAFCGSLAFFAMLGFYPFCFLLLSMTKYALKWNTAYNVVVDFLRDYYPTGQDFLLRNLENSVATYGKELQFGSMLWILLGAAGIFIPLETAFNRLWKVEEDRPYWRNQTIGFLLTGAFCCLAVAFVVVSAVVQSTIIWLPLRLIEKILVWLALKLALPIAAFWAGIFLLYKFLPNRRIEAREVLPPAFLVGILAEVVRYIYNIALPWMDLQKSQGPYYVSVSFVLLAYFEAFIVLGGAFLATETTKYPWLTWPRRKT